MSAKAAFIDAAAVCLRVGREAGDRMRQKLLSGSIEQATKIQGEQSGAIACAEELIRLAGRMTYDDTIEGVRRVVDVRLEKVASTAEDITPCIYCGKPGNVEGMHDKDNKPTCLSCYIKLSQEYSLSEHVRLGK